MKKPLLTTLIIVLSMTVFTSAENYSTELQAAYDYAHSINITTMSSIDSANMNGSLIRVHMAKMIVNYTKEILGLTPNTSLPCIFTDIADQSAELQGYIVQACQLGLMGQEMSAFKPNDLVSRAQFGTVLSRALYGDMYNGSDPYYKDHLAALRDVGIMTKIDIPTMTETRGYVMLMMMRAGTESTISICTTQPYQNYCSLGLELCPSECLPSSLPLAGTLSFSKISKNISDSSDGVHFGSLQLTASDDTILLTSITLKADLGTMSSTQVRLETEGVRITAKKIPSSDGNIIVSFFPTLTIVKGQSAIVDIFASNKIKSLTLTNSSNIASSAQSLLGSFPMVIK